MNIDFHFGYIYAVARLGGLDSGQAETVAHACQYIDDSTTNGILKFKNGESFERFAAAHKLFDFGANHNSEQDKLVWTPFHFLPGGDGDTIEKKAICKKDSAIAQEMIRTTLRRCLDKAKDPDSAGNALHRLGVALHAYVDTWAHHDFSGFPSDHNKVHSLKSDDPDEGFLKRTLDTLESIAANVSFRLGHGGALHYPDWPWASWRYTSGDGKPMLRNNLDEFLDAADAACKVIQAYVHDSTNLQEQAGLSAAALNAIRGLMENNRDENEGKRFNVVMEAIRDGGIPGIPAGPVPGYVDKGVGSWKHAATGSDEVDDEGPAPEWSETFEASDYRKFHDAVKEHRSFVISTLLPKHGIRLV
jgi:hypothetical protein